MNAQLIAGGGFIIFGIAALGLIVYLARRDGILSTQKGIADRDVEAAKRISDAEGGAPHNGDDLVQRLRDGGKL